MKIQTKSIEIVTPENEPYAAAFYPSKPGVPSFCVYAQQGKRLYNFTIWQGDPYWQCEVTDNLLRKLAVITREDTLIRMANDHMSVDVDEEEILIKNLDMSATFTSDKTTLKSVKVEIYASSSESSEAHADNEPQPGPEGDS